jgi:hypothetical protein
MTLLSGLLDLWDDARGVFRQARVWERARRLALSQLACLERHTVTGLLCSCGRQFVDWSADYRLFSKDAWDANHLFRPVLRASLALLPDAGRVVLAIDDTLLRKSGRKTPGVAYRRDPLSPAFQTNLILAQRFVQFSLLIPNAPGLPAAARGVPCRFEHVPSLKKPRSNATQEERDVYREGVKQQNLNTATCRMIRQLRDELNQVHHAEGCQLVLVVDGSYTNQTVISALPGNTTLIGRIRKDAKLYFPHESSPRQYGRAAPTPEQLRQDDQIPWQEIEAYAAGRTHTFRVKSLTPIRWRKTGTKLPLRVVVIAPVGYRLTQGGRLLYRQPAYLICTDPSLQLQPLLQEYLWRWDIEVNHRDEKQVIGVGQAQVRAPKSVHRQPAFAVACYSMLLLAALNVFGPNRLDDLLPLPKWQPRGARCRLSTQRLVQLLRHEVWGLALKEVAAADRKTDFVTNAAPHTKSPDLILAPLPPVAYARTG